MNRGARKGILRRDLHPHYEYCLPQLQPLAPPTRSRSSPRMDNIQDLSAVWSSYLVNCTSFGALAFLVWESCIAFDDEVNYIWTSFTFVKYLYLWSRYFALASQILNHILIQVLQSKHSLSPRFCRVLSSYHLFVGQGLVTGMELILILRVHALYNRSRRVGVFLSVVFISSLVIQVIGGILVIGAQEFDPICTPIKKPLGLLYFGIAAGLSQSIIFLMTIHKHITSLTTGFGRTPIVSLMIRDGASVFVLISAIILVTVTFAVLHGLNRFLWHLTFSWFVSVVSTAGCRLIVNMQRLAVPRPQNPSSDFDFTTGIYEDHELDHHMSAVSFQPSNSG